MLFTKLNSDYLVLFKRLLEGKIKQVVLYKKDRLNPKKNKFRIQMLC